MISLIDKYLPKFTFNEKHQIIVDSNKNDAYNITRQLDFSSSKTIKSLFSLRGISTNDMTLEGLIKELNFTYLEEKAPKEFIVGSLAKKIAKQNSSKASHRVHKSYNIELVWDFRFDELNINQTKVTTETRVLCLDNKTKSLFRLYWFFIKPFSGWIRLEMLRIIKLQSELQKNKNATQQ